MSRLCPLGRSLFASAVLSVSVLFGATAQAQSLAVLVEPGAGGLPADELRAAIAAEAGVSLTSTITLDTTRLLVSQDGGAHLRFELVAPDGRRVERAVDLGAVPQGSAVDTAALVAANLLEDEASGLIASLRQKNAPPEVPKPKAAPPVPLLPPPCERRPGDVMQFVGADVFPYVGTSTFERPNTVRHLSLEFVGGHHAGVRGVQFSPLVSYGGEFVCGVQFGSLVSHTSGSVTGVSFAGLGSYHGGAVDGLSFAGLGSWVGGHVDGVGFAGGALRTEDADGVTFAGFINVARHVEGVHLAGAIGWTDSITGLQLGGVASFSARKMTGLQVAPLAFASDVHGMQLGTMNIGGYVHGVQLGLVNIARTSDASIGLLSFVSEGRTHLDGWVASDGTASIAVQHGSLWVHNYYGGTVSFTGDGGVTAGPLLGIGVHLPAAPFFVDIDLIAHVLFDPNESGTPQALHTGRVIAGYQLSPEFALYAGPTFNALLAQKDETHRAHTFSALEIDLSSGDSRNRLWPGLVLGVRGF